jgi:peptide subunit release factor 1 (eRF1)
MYDDILGKEIKPVIKKCKKCGELYMAFEGFNIDPKDQPCPHCHVEVDLTDFVTKFEYNKTCPECGSKNIEAVEPFDYIKKCNDCGHQFVTGEHN